jgi:UDP-N-acetylmuramate--alanine ligase
MATDVRLEGTQTRFRVVVEGEDRGDVTLHMAGRYNVANALAAISVGLEFDVPFARIREAIEEFSGVERRFELRGESDGIAVYDTYSHHPTEILVALEGARQIAAGRGATSRVVVAFQPHRYTRTRDCFDDFARANHGADALVITDIYPAGEAKIAGIDSAALADAIRDTGHRNVHLANEREQIVPQLRELAAPGDLVVFMGAGDIGRLAADYLEGGDSA